MEKYFEQMGIDKDRIHLEWISASEGKQFAELVDNFTEKVQALGPCDVKEVIETLS